MKVLVCLFALFVAANCSIIQTRPCAGDKSQSELISVAIEPCESGNCVLHKGSEASIIIKMKPKSDITSLTTEVKGKIGIYIPFPLQNPDACATAGLTCPLKAGQEVTYKFSLPVSKYYPSLSLVVRWRLFDQNKNTQICFEFPTELQ